MIELIYHKMQKSLNAAAECNDDTSNGTHHLHHPRRRRRRRSDPIDNRHFYPDKEESQSKQAQKLLFHMVKGTQELAMSENTQALRGYVRHKFIEWAMSIASSLSQLLPNTPLLLCCCMIDGHAAF
jgi:hypothetical protein